MIVAKPVVSTANIALSSRAVALRSALSIAWRSSEWVFVDVAAGVG
jgi:hypothetical protein